MEPGLEPRVTAPFLARPGHEADTIGRPPFGPLETINTVIVAEQGCQGSDLGSQEGRNRLVIEELRAVAIRGCLLQQRGQLARPIRAHQFVES